MPVFDIGLEQVSLSYATKNICDNVTVGVNEGDRIGIVGRNGDGKTTVLHLLSGSQQPDSGRVSARNGLSLGILEQYDSLDDNDTVQQAALGGQEEYEWASRQHTREIVETLLSGIGLDSRIGSLSGGQRRRVDLARLLLGDWDILLLDEPTNHLDMATIRWLAEHLKNRWQRGAGALLVVTHDRWFLDDVCTHMWEVHDGDIDPFEGGYSAYIEQRVERDRQADAAEARRRNLARKELAWLARGARARSTKQKFHVKAARELIADVPDVRNTLQLKQMAVSRLGKTVVDLEGVSVAYPGNNGSDEETPGGFGHTVLDNITWLIGPGDRFGIVGANGAGKSTLLRVIDGSLEPSSGRVKIGKTVKFAVLSQRLDELEGLGEYTVNEVLGRYRSVYLVDGKETTPVQLMERLGFGSAQLMTPVRDLSGGQKRRMQLLLILLDEPNVLIMDEPGNDLDTDMLAVMEDLLDTWPGTLIVVSHDSYLLERVTDQQFALDNGKIVHLPGGINDYFDMLDRSADNSRHLGASAAVSREAPGQDGDRGKALRAAKREASRRAGSIERKINKLNASRTGIEDQMAAWDPGDYEGLSRLNVQLHGIEAEIAALEEEWLELQEFMEDTGPNFNTEKYGN